VVKKLGGIPVKNVEEYMKVLSRFKKGDTTTVEIQRKSEIKVLNLTF
jgi:S1-C subfamily serine protease